jgi:[lysine-biosynthesis-protein LysW]---L-2-aminoadipate ligase
VSKEKTASSLTILYDSIRWEEKALYEAARKRGIQVDKIDCKYLSIDLNQTDSFSYRDRIIIQRCVSYFKSIHSTAALEGLGAYIINSLHTATVCGNKLFAHMQLQRAGVKTPRAISAFCGESAIESLNTLGYPAVIKPTIGSWGRLIALLRDKEAAKAVIEDREHMFPLYQIYYFEEFINRPPRDIRAIVIDDKVVAAIYRYSRSGEWKTNMALGGHAEICPVTKDLEDICLKATKAVAGKIVGVDLMESKEHGLIVHEINNTTEFRNTVSVTGVDIPGLMVDFSSKLGK